MLCPTALLLLWAPIISTELARDVVCVNDFLHTINCSLRVTPPAHQRPDNSYWFSFSRDVFENHALKRKTDKCIPSYTESSYFCSFISREDVTFPDQISFQIDLCHEADGCKELVKNYFPKNNITPIAPSKLSVVLNSSQLHFSWVTSYEAYLSTLYLKDNLKFHLHMAREDQEEPPKLFSQIEMSLAMDVEEFAVGAEYTTRVRSTPDGNDYKGQWGQWSQEVRWRTPAEDPGPVGLDIGLILTVCLLLPVLLLLCSIPILRLRKRNTSVLIPTPVLHFSTLNKYYQGHIQSLAVNLGMDKAPVQMENTDQIYVLTKRVDVPVEDGKELLHQDPGAQRGAPCGGGQKPALDVSSLGFPYSVTPGPDEKSCWAPESSAEGDSGCWHCSVTSGDGERDQRWYRNAYCTLTDRQCHLDHLDHQTTAGGEHSDPAGFLRRAAVDYQNQAQQLSSSA